MITPYEVWDNESANLVFAYATEEEVLEDVREMIRLYGPDSVKMWVLQFDDYEAPPRNIAAGDALVALAFASPPARIVAD